MYITGFAEGDLFFNMLLLQYLPDASTVQSPLRPGECGEKLERR